MKKTVAAWVMVFCSAVGSVWAEERKPDVGFVPTPEAAVARMVEMAELRAGDMVYDLGCGDGRIVVAAAR
ncbi:MAG: hypothetical protein WEC72_01925, partial [Chthoniobacterales bacterium]